MSNFGLRFSYTLDTSTFKCAFLVDSFSLSSVGSRQSEMIKKVSAEVTANRCESHILFV